MDAKLLVAAPAEKLRVVTVYFCQLVVPCVLEQDDVLTCQLVKGKRNEPHVWNGFEGLLRLYQLVRAECGKAVDALWLVFGPDLLPNFVEPVVD